MENDKHVAELRCEFVGIMFALAVGEVALQTAGLVQAGQVVRYLPAYSHLFLALFVIGCMIRLPLPTSWLQQMQPTDSWQLP